MFLVLRSDLAIIDIMYILSQTDEKFDLLTVRGEECSLGKTINVHWIIVDESDEDYPDILQDFCEQALETIKQYNENTSRLLSILMEKR